MGKVLKIILAFVVSWMFFYPLNFTFLPDSINSKMIVAVLGLVILWKDLVDRKTGLVTKQSVIWMFVIAGVFSLICFASTVINNTETKDYVTYVVSMAIWFSAAYASYGMVRYAHGKVSVELLAKYVVALCVVQGCLSFAFHVSPPIRSFFSQFFYVLEATKKSGVRLFGLGASSDTGGIKYAISLVLAGYLLCRTTIKRKEYLLLILSFWVIVVLGNMMSRTTTVGALLAIAYIVFCSIRGRSCDEKSYHPLRRFLSVSICLVPFLLVFNRLFPQASELYKFAFEGFYRFLETGEWETSSTNILWEMWSIWPTNLKTWMIGDGLFLDPNDPTLYYMGTDVGYARFVFFCGLLGLIVFAMLFVYLRSVLKDRLPQHSELFLLLLILVFAVWIKVTTDIFLIFALLLCVRPEDEQGLIDENTI